MNQDKRFLLTSAILFGILLAWTVLLPHPVPRTKGQKPEQPPERTATTAATPSPKLESPAGEPTQRVDLGPYRLAVGERSGAVRDWEVNGQPLLVGAEPGVLLLDAGIPESAQVQFRTRMEGEKAVTEGIWANHLRLAREISLHGNGQGYLLDCRIAVVNLSKESKRVPVRLLVFSRLFAQQQDQPLLHGAIRGSEKVQEVAVKLGRTRQFPAPAQWVASQGKSHLLVVQPVGFEKETVFHVEHPPALGPLGWLELGEVELAPGTQRDWKLRLYAGPLAIQPLEKAGLQEALSFGAFSGVARGMLRFMGWSYGWMRSYGWAICLLSLVVCIVMAPVTWYSTWMSQRMMQKMAAVRPQEQRIRKEHQGNPHKLQQELMGLYRKHGVNPASGCLGCLPLLLTWPVYIALFQVLTRSPELEGARFLLIRNLAKPDHLVPLPGTLPLIGSSVNVLPFLAVGSILWQQKALQQPDSMMTDEQRMQQEMMKKVLPVLFLVIFYALPSGFMLYLVVNSALTAGLQLWVKKLASARA